MAHCRRLAPADLVVHENIILGTGGAGSVYKGTLTVNGTNGQQDRLPVAVKVLDTARTSEVPHELVLLGKALAKCPFVCQPYGYTVKDRKTCLVLKLYEKSLAQHIDQQPDRRLGLKDVVRIGKQLAEAVRTLHVEARIAHFDIKPENILLDAAGTCFLSDFSIAHAFPDGQSRMPLPFDAYGSAQYMAPEQAKDRGGAGISFKADVWGLAATLLEMYTGRPPFPHVRDIQVLNALLAGQGPSLPATMEPRLKIILHRSFVINPDVRQDATVLRHSLSHLGEVLRIEAGGQTDVPGHVLASADLQNSRPRGASTTGGAAAGTSATSNTTQFPPEADLLGLDSLGTEQRQGSGPTGQRALPEPRAPARKASRTGSSGRDTPAGLPEQRELHRVGASAEADAAAARDSAAANAEAVVITAGTGGCLGVKCLYRSFTTLLQHPHDTKQMTGVALVPQSAESQALREAVSVSASQNLTWWDLSEGTVACCADIGQAQGAPRGLIGRSVIVSDRFAVVGTDKSMLSVWQFRNGGSSWVTANEGRTGGQEVAPHCVAMATMGGHEANRLYDLAVQPPWLGDPGGAWVASASCAGNLSIWDAATWQEIFRARASNGPIYGCTCMAGSNMVAVACQAPQLAQIWDCRQAPKHVAAVMTCDLDPRLTQGDDAPDSIYCVWSVPAAGGALPSQLLLGSRKGHLYVWDLRSANALWTIAQLSDKVLGCASSPCGKRVVAASRGGQVVMLDWTRALSGQQIMACDAPHVSHWECSNPMYVWPKQEQGILRVASGNLIRGNLLAGKPVSAAR